jgi:molecular chaperone GrpE
MGKGLWKKKENLKNKVNGNDSKSGSSDNNINNKSNIGVNNSDDKNIDNIDDNNNNNNNNNNNEKGKDKLNISNGNSNEFNKSCDVESYIKQIEEFKSKIKNLENNLLSKDEQVLRLQADYDNLLKRTSKQIEEIKCFANKDFAISMMDIVDNFERAFINSKESKDIVSFRDGMKLIYKKIIDVFDKFGIKKIECIGNKFDPNLHEAVVTFESEDHGDDVIVDELQKGYSLNDKIIRFPKVRVAKNCKKED